MKNLYYVVSYWQSYCDEYGNKEIQQSRAVVEASSAEDALRYFTKGSEDWQNYTDKEEEPELLIGSYNEKDSNVLESTFRIEVLRFKPDVEV